jgi:hypothetical protein
MEPPPAMQATVSCEDVAITGLTDTIAMKEKQQPSSAAVDMATEKAHVNDVQRSTNHQAMPATTGLTDSPLQHMHASLERQASSHVSSTNTEFQTLRSLNLFPPAPEDQEPSATIHTNEYHEKGTTHSNKVNSGNNSNGIQSTCIVDNDAWWHNKLNWGRLGVIGVPLGFFALLLIVVAGIGLAIVVLPQTLFVLLVGLIVGKCGNAIVEHVYMLSWIGSWHVPLFRAIMWYGYGQRWHSRFIDLRVDMSLPVRPDASQGHPHPSSTFNAPSNNAQADKVSYETNQH